MNKLIIAPDSFKGSLPAVRVCDIIESAARRHFPQLAVTRMPVSDGGEGLVDALLFGAKGERVTVQVSDPLMREIQASYGILSTGEAVIEMAAASGLPLLAAGKRNPMYTTTYGTGQLILDALDRGCRKIILGFGGSATNDGGAGLAAALGIRFLDKDDQPVLNGDNLSRVVRIDAQTMAHGLSSCRISIACDIANPLYGPQGAAHVFGPQKGATPEQVTRLDGGLRILAELIHRQTGINMQEIPGAGAAGGAPVPLIAFANAQLVSGIELVLDRLDFDKDLETCDLVITGEGQTDAQSTMGKVVCGVGRRAKAAGVPVVVISGSLRAGYEGLYDEGITAVFSAVRGVCTLEQALVNAEENLRRSAEDIFRLIKASR